MPEDKRERSRSPRRHRSERSPESRSKSHKSHRHRDEADEDRHRKHRRDRDRDRDRDETEDERKERKRAKKEKRKEDRRDRDKLDVVDDDDDADLWVEKGAGAEVRLMIHMRRLCLCGADWSQSVVANVPSAAGLPLKSHASEPAKGPLPDATSTDSKTQERQAWMLEPPVTAPPVSSKPFGESNFPKCAGTSAGRSQPITTDMDMTDGYGENESSNRTMSGGVDFFSGLGTEHKRKDPQDDKPDPTKLQIHDTELNKQLLQGKNLDDYEVKGEPVCSVSWRDVWMIADFSRQEGAAWKCWVSVEDDEAQAIV